MTDPEKSGQNKPTNVSFWHLSLVVGALGVGFTSSEYLNSKIDSPVITTSAPNLFLSHPEPEPESEPVTYNIKDIENIVPSSDDGVLLRVWAYRELGPFKRVPVYPLMVSILPDDSDLILTADEAATCSNNVHLGTMLLTRPQDFQIQGLSPQERAGDLIGFKLTEHYPEGDCDQNPAQIWVGKDSLDKFSEHLSSSDSFITKGKYVISTPKRGSEKEKSS